MKTPLGLLIRLVSLRMELALRVLRTKDIGD